MKPSFETEKSCNPNKSLNAKRLGYFKVSAGFRVALPSLRPWVNRQRQSKSKNLLSQDQIERLEAFSGWSWDPIKDQWEEAFEQLNSYVKQHGNAKIPPHFINQDGFNLWNWAQTQRQNKSKNILTQDRIELLQSLHGWSWGTQRKSWKEVFEQLQSYVKTHGNSRVPGSYVSPDGLKLGIWVNHQRQSYSNNTLSPDRIEYLETLPGWTWDPLTQQWEEAFEQLRSYVKQQGSAKVSTNYINPDGNKLGIWVQSQRRSKSKNLLSQDQVERLEMLPGWVWKSNKVTTK